MIFSSLRSRFFPNVNLQGLVILALHLSAAFARCDTEHHEKPSVIAQKAAQFAKVAEEAQIPAGEQAAHRVKEQLAEKAAEASKAAEAALGGKLEVVAQLKKEIQDSETVMQEEQASLHQLQATAQSATKAHEEAKAEVKILTTTLQLAKANEANAAQAQEGIQQQVSEKEQLLDTANSRLEQLKKQLHVAKTELTRTRDSARKAEAAASEAKQNVARSRRKSFKKREDDS